MSGPVTVAEAAAGAAGRTYPVHEVREALRQRRHDQVGLRLGEPAGGHGVGELLLLVRDERGDEAGRLRPCDLRERLAGLQLREQIGGRGAEIRRGRGEVVARATVVRECARRRGRRVRRCVAFRGEGRAAAGERRHAGGHEDELSLCHARSVGDGSKKRLWGF